MLLSRILTSFLFLFLLLFPVLMQASTGVFINEIAWMGTKESTYNEWLELYNNSSTTLSLDGWVLKLGDKEIALRGDLKPGSFYLLERTDDNALPEIKANQIYSGSLQNSGEKLTLINRNKNIIDEIDCREGWYKGENTSKRTMEKRNGKWQTSSKIGGTPKKENSEGYTEKKEKYIDLTLASSKSIRYRNFGLVLLISLITAFISAIIVLLIDKKINIL